MPLRPRRPLARRTVNCPPQVAANLNAKYGLDQPLWRQITSYAGASLAHFDFGPSFVYKDRTCEPDHRAGLSDYADLCALLVLFALAVIVGVSLGLLAADPPHTLLVTLPWVCQSVAQVLPNFVMAPIFGG